MEEKRGVESSKPFVEPAPPVRPQTAAVRQAPKMDFDEYIDEVGN